MSTDGDLESWVCMSTVSNTVPGSSYPWHWSEYFIMFYSSTLLTLKTYLMCTTGKWYKLCLSRHCSVLELWCLVTPLVPMMTVANPWADSHPLLTQSGLMPSRRIFMTWMQFLRHLCLIASWIWRQMVTRLPSRSNQLACKKGDQILSTFYTLYFLVCWSFIL